MYILLNVAMSSACLALGALGAGLSSLPPSLPPSHSLARSHGGGYSTVTRQLLDRGIPGREVREGGAGRACVRKAHVHIHMCGTPSSPAGVTMLTTTTTTMMMVFVCVCVSCVCVCVMPVCRTCPCVVPASCHHPIILFSGSSVVLVFWCCSGVFWSCGLLQARGASPPPAPLAATARASIATAPSARAPSTRASARCCQATCW